MAKIVLGQRGSVFAFQPGGTARPGVYTDWSALIDAMALAWGTRFLDLNASFVAGSATVPVGAWDPKFAQGPIVLRGRNDANTASPSLMFQDGATLVGGFFNELRDYVVVVNQNTTDPLCTFTGSILTIDFYTGAALEKTASTTPFVKVTNTNGSGPFSGLVVRTHDDSFLYNDVGLGSEFFQVDGPGSIGLFLAFDQSTIPSSSIKTTNTPEFVQLSLCSTAATMDPSQPNAPGLTVTNNCLASNESYADTVSPALGATTVQAAIDKLKTAGINCVLLQPGGVAGGGVFTDPALCAAATAGMSGDVDIIVDTSLGALNITTSVNFGNGIGRRRLLGNPNNKYAQLITVANANITLLGITDFEYVQLTSKSTAPALIPISGTQQLNVTMRGQSILIQDVAAAGSIFGVSGSGVLELYMDDESGITTLNGGTLAIVASGGGAAVLRLHDSAYIDSNLLSDSVGTGLIITLIVGSSVGFSPSSQPAYVNQGSHNISYRPLASNITYADGVTPALGSTFVQGAIDALKAVAAAKVASASGTLPITVTGTTALVVGINAATGSLPGSMSATDKTKLDAITGTNTGDQTIGLTGDVTGTGTGAFAATLNGAYKDGEFVFSFDGQGSVITAGSFWYFPLPYKCTITGWEIVGKEPSGSIVVDLWKVTNAAYPPTVANSIAGTDKPTIVSGQRVLDTTLAGFGSTAVAKGDWMGIHIDSATTFTWAQLRIITARIL